jgi:phage terminase small subunit
LEPPAENPPQPFREISRNPQNRFAVFCHHSLNGTPAETKQHSSHGRHARTSSAAERAAIPAWPGDAPKGMSAAAKRIWLELQRELTGTLCRTDRLALRALAEDEALLADAYAGIQNLLRLATEKAVAEGKALPAGALVMVLNSPISRQLVPFLRDLANPIVIEQREFGLTPSSRTRVALSDFNNSIDVLEAKLCGDL